MPDTAHAPEISSPGGPLVEGLKGTIVLVTGATGFTGSHLLHELVRLGAQVRALARPSSNIEPFKNLPIQWIRGQVFEAEAVRQAALGVQYVFHLAAAYREARLDRNDYVRTHVISTRLLAEAASKQNAFRRFVHVSTIGVHGHIPNPPADESEPMRPGDIYQETKAEGERWLRDYAQRTGLPFTVLRPCGIFGPGDRRLLKIFKLATRPLFPVLGFGQGLYHLVHVEDLTQMILLAAVHPGAASEVFICGNAEATSIAAMGRTIAGILGRNTRVVRIPAAPVYFLGWLCEGFCRPLGWEPILYRRRVAFFTKDRSFNTEKIRRVLGYQLKYSNEEGLKQTAEWYRAKGWLK